ncbi:MAG: polyketide synthase, partial [Acidobacteriota bacterium]
MADRLQATARGTREKAFSPIAVVGRSCLLPGAASPEDLWRLVSEGRSAIGRVPEGRWRLDPEDVRCAPGGADSQDRTWSDLGGYVRGFEKIFEPSGFAVPEERLAGLDELFLWTLHAARQALRDSGDAADGGAARPRTAAIFGNLSFPSREMNAFSESVWFGDRPRPHAFNRFTSSGPATLLAEALRLGGGAWCLDAACASSLVAIKLACDRLHLGEVDRVLAGAVNRTDDLFIHVGFCALQAMSRAGWSRPFSAEADGLLPAEGAGFVVLKRLQDALRDGDTVHGVIRGAGLSNDGRGQGLLAPSTAGQERALRAAYAGSGVDPSEVSLLECHATGTPVGDAAELRSSAGVLGRENGQRLPIGSLKSNLGHLVTVAGVAGLIKVLEAMKHGVRPRTLGCENPLPEIADSPFRLLGEAEAWPSDGPRIAGISAFGFGGNNAHLVVQEPHDAMANLPCRDPQAAAGDEIAVVGIGLTVGPVHGRGPAADLLESGGSAVAPGAEGAGLEARAESVEVALGGLKFPPRDLQQSLAQQVMLLETAREAARDAVTSGPGGELPEARRLGVVMGMEADPEIGRYGARWRMAERARSLDPSPPEGWLEA